MLNGQKVKVEMEIEVTSISDDDTFGTRSFLCGNVDLGPHERMTGKRKTAYVSGVPLICVKENQ